MSEYENHLKNFKDYSKEDLIKELLSHDLERCTLITSLKAVEKSLQQLPNSLTELIQYLEARDKRQFFL